MRAVGWPDQILPPPDTTVGFTVVSDVRPRAVDLFDCGGQSIERTRLTAHDSTVGLLSTPKSLGWGTVFTLIKSPSLQGGPVPIAQRGGATLWFSREAVLSSGGHAVEWVDPGQWYLVASHVTTERVWWDVIGWGTGAGSTVDASCGAQLRDNGLTLIALNEPLVVATMQFHSRTFGHDELMGFADQRLLPSDPTIRWNLHDSVLADMVVGSVEPAPSWDATSLRSRKRAIQIVPVAGAAWRSESKTPRGTIEVCIGRSGDGFVISVDSPAPTPTYEPMPSLMNTPFPNDDD